MNANEYITMLTKTRIILRKYTVMKRKTIITNLQENICNVDNKYDGATTVTSELTATTILIKR